MTRRSPIEAMVDQACGIGPGQIEQMQKEAEALADKQTKALLSVEKNARAWWKMRRPLNWTTEQHLKNPTVNCTGPDEEKLARSVAKWIKLGG